MSCHRFQLSTDHGQLFFKKTGAVPVRLGRGTLFSDKCVKKRQKQTFQFAGVTPGEKRLQGKTAVKKRQKRKSIRQFAFADTRGSVAGTLFFKKRPPCSEAGPRGAIQGPPPAEPRPAPESARTKNIKNATKIPKNGGGNSQKSRSIAYSQFAGHLRFSAWSPISKKTAPCPGGLVAGRNFVNFHGSAK